MASEKYERKTAQFYSEFQTEQKYEFASDADINLGKEMNKETFLNSLMIKFCIVIIMR